MNSLDNDKLRDLLNKRRKSELVEWIIEQAEVNEDLRRALISLVAPQANVATLASELNRMINAAWGRTRVSRDPWKLAQPIASDLGPVLSALEQLIERGHAEAAEKVLRRFVDLAAKGLDQVDDSYGYLGPLCQDAVTLWGKAWAKISPRDPLKLAKLVFEGVRDNGYAIRDHMIRDFAQALGREGLLSLKELFLAEHHANVARPEMNDWARRKPLRHLADVADALGDVDLYIEVQRQCGMEETYAMPIARRLLDAGRAGEANAYLDRADPARSYFHSEKDDYTTLRCKILQALGRDDEARDALWQEFRRGLSTTALDQLLTLTPDDKRQGVIDDAIAVAEAHVDRLAAATFLVAHGQTGRAAKLVDAHSDNSVADPTSPCCNWPSRFTASSPHRPGCCIAPCFWIFLRESVRRRTTTPPTIWPLPTSLRRGPAWATGSRNCWPSSARGTDANTPSGTWSRIEATSRLHARNAQTAGLPRAERVRPGYGSSRPDGSRPRRPKP